MLKVHLFGDVNFFFFYLNKLFRKSYEQDTSKDFYLVSSGVFIKSRSGDQD